MRQTHVTRPGAGSKRFPGVVDRPGRTDADDDDPVLRDLAVAFLAEYRSRSFRAQDGEAVDWFADLPKHTHPPADRQP